MNVSPNAVPGDQYLVGLFTFLCRAIRANLFLTVLMPLASWRLHMLPSCRFRSVYTAQVNVRIGRVEGTEAISITGAVSRINSLSFKQRVIEGNGLRPSRRPACATDLSQFGRKAGSSRHGRVECTGNRRSAGAGRRGIVVRLLNEEQRKIREPLEADIKEQLATYDATITGLHETRKSLAVLMKEDPQGAFCRSDIARAAKSVVGRSHLA